MTDCFQSNRRSFAAYRIFLPSTLLCSLVLLVLPTPAEAGRDWSEAVQRLEAIEAPGDEEEFIVFRATGDLMAHDTQNTAAYRGERGYNFFEGFNTVRHLLEGADIMYGNLETVLGGPTRPYKGFPLFTTPDSYAEGLKRTGFDILQTVNNHSNDQREAGLLRTLEVLASFDIPSLGTYASAEEAASPWVVLKAKGLQIGFLAYTVSTNGIPTPRGREYQVSKLEEDKVLREIAELRALGVDAVIVGLHWGREYAHEPLSYQPKLARKMVAAGADVILGGHPHVLQPMELIEIPPAEGLAGRSGLIIYSLGNFVSNMPFPETELGIILEVTRARPRSGGPARIAGVGYAPIWVQKYGRGTSRRYFVRDVVEVVRLCDEGSDLLKAEKISSEHCRQARWSLEHVAGFYGTALRYGGGPRYPDPRPDWHRLHQTQLELAEPGGGNRPPPPRVLTADDMLLVPGGPLLQPSPASYDGARAIADQSDFDLASRASIPVPPFAIDRLEVRSKDYAEFLEAHPSEAAPGQGPLQSHRLAWVDRKPPKGLEEHPVVLVSMDEARNYCAWRNKRLPSRLEWEFAAAGSEALVFPWGDAWIDDGANWFEDRWANVPAPDGHPGTAPAGSFPAGSSQFGALDMSGNVEEWVEPLGAGLQEAGLLKGGSWFDRDPHSLRVAHTQVTPPGFRSVMAGFRCARDLQPGEQATATEP
ncbi:MAG: CapA family protein [Myxococcota bacterium]|nr:CapA family protein [Myxococcota bacterium]